jgi:L-histidine N-alpha-methyltransferase
MAYQLDSRADDLPFHAMLAEDVRRGLTHRPLSIPPKYFYDAAGSRLFERITELPEYYLTRVEESLLPRVALDLARRFPPDDIVELGPGSCRKLRGLLAMLGPPPKMRYFPVDIDGDALARLATDLSRDYPLLQVDPVIGDFERHLDRIPPPVSRRLVLLLGSTIGNVEPPDRRALCARLRDLLGPDGRLLLGVDLVKSRDVLEAAYNDAAGVTREFNRNILRVVNRALDGDFQPEAYRHHAFYSVEDSRIEMHLVATAPQRVELRRIGLLLRVDKDEGIWTENSYKFTRESTEAMLNSAGLALESWYTDEERRFGLALAQPAG